MLSCTSHLAPQKRDGVGNVKSYSRVILTGTHTLIFRLSVARTFTMIEKDFNNIDHFCKFVGEDGLFVMKPLHEPQQGKIHS